MGRASSRKRRQREIQGLDQAMRRIEDGTADDAPVPSFAAFAVHAESFAGPIPPPALLERYNDIIPDGANRIMRMAEQQTQHRMDLESRVVKNDVLQSRLGIASGTLLGVGVLVLGGFMVASGHAVEGAGIVTATLGGVVGTFLYATNTRKTERVEKWREVAEVVNERAHRGSRSESR